MYRVQIDHGQTGNCTGGLNRAARIPLALWVTGSGAARSGPACGVALRQVWT